MLTKEQLRRIEEIIRRRFLSFTYEALGDQVLSEVEITALQEAGLLRPSVRNMIGDSYTLGKVVSLFNRAEARKMGFEAILKRAKTMKPITRVEEQSARWAKEHAAQYIQGLSDSMVRDVRGSVARAATSK